MGKRGEPGRRGLEMTSATQEWRRADAQREVSRRLRKWHKFCKKGKNPPTESENVQPLLVTAEVDIPRDPTGLLLQPPPCSPSPLGDLVTELGCSYPPRHGPGLPEALPCALSRQGRAPRLPHVGEAIRSVLTLTPAELSAQNGGLSSGITLLIYPTYLPGRA